MKGDNSLLLRLSRSILLLVALGALALAIPALAQTDGVQDAAGSAPVKYFDFFVVKGGPIAFGLIILSIVTIALTIEHCLSIRRATIVPAQVTRQAHALIEEKKYLEALQFTAEDPSMFGYVLNAALLEASNGFAAMERAVEETLEERSAKLFRKTEFLSIIGNVSPMIGLLGTVTGMIMLFAEIHAADTFPGARIVADRIAVALITTFWGLAVAIPALSIYAIFRNRIDVLTAECALATEHLISMFKPETAGSEPDETSAPSRTP